MALNQSNFSLNSIAIAASSKITRSEADSYAEKKTALCLCL